MGFITSIPEFFIGISSALNKIPIYSFGNLIGANIANLGLVLGIAVLLARNLTITKKIAKQDAMYMLIVAILPLVLISDGVLSRPDGLVLIGFFAFYATHLIYRGKRDGKERKETSYKELIGNLASLVVSVYLLFLSSQLLVNSGLSVSKDLGFPLVLIGIFTAIGTTLPELAFTLKSVPLHRGQMTLGNIIGSVVINSSLILGIVALIYPIAIANVTLVLVSSIFLVFYLFLFLVMSKTGEQISIHEGFVLLLLYIFFIIITYSLR
jgi:cation:H+ antiporter